LVREIAVQDISELIEKLREDGRSEHTIAGALVTLSSVMRFAVRNGWIRESPVSKLEHDERPRPAAPQQRALGLEEIARLLDGALPKYRVLIATALYTGMRHSEVLGLTWSDVDPAGGLVHVRAQLSRAHSQRVKLKTPCSMRRFRSRRSWRCS
jgi:integrase